jgi:flagellar motility protein MotE (MotC chaperone)
MAMPRIRVLPVVIAVSIGALAFKGADIAKAVAENGNPETAPSSAPDPAAAALTGQDEETPPPAGAATGATNAQGQCVPGTDYAGETGISEQEILVLRSLSDRRAQLEQREAAATTAEQLNAASLARIQEQIAQLRAVEANVQQLLASMEVKADERLANLVRTYEGMRPADAARVFDALDDTVMVELAKAMKPAVLAAIMAKMQVPRAENLTRRLAALAAPPPITMPNGPQAAAAPTAAPSPAASTPPRAPAAPAARPPAPRATPSPAAAVAPPAAAPPPPTPAVAESPSPAPAGSTPG